MGKDNEIRPTNPFVTSSRLPNFGFTFDIGENERPAYHPSDLLKLFIYGSLNRMRFSRTLGKESSRKIALMWLLKGLILDYNTIANFRKNNPKAFGNF